MAKNGAGDVAQSLVVVGGITPIIPPDRPEIVDLARFAVKTQTEYPNLVFKKVIKAGRQVVSGVKYYITLEAEDGNRYETQIWVQEWIPKKEVLVFRRLPMPGQPQDIPDAPTNEEVIELAHFAVDEHNKQEHENLVFKGVVKASEQVVSGLLYRITLKAAKAGDFEKVYEASVLLPAGPHEVKVLLEFKPVVEKKRKLEPVEAGQPVDIPDASTNEEIIQLAQFAIDKHNKKAGTHLVFKRVVKASAHEQIPGSLNVVYTITLEAGEEGSDHSGFYVAVVLTMFLPPGLDGRVLLSFNPAIQLGQTKPLPGGVTPIPITTEVIALAVFAVKEYNTKKGKHLAFKELLKAESQLVSGTLYTFYLVATEDGKRGQYKAQVWVEPWETRLDMTAFDYVGPITGA
ncbi:hypothetical protein Tsubulata_026621 [Turnera subulata]|uniref:Cysteine proteinase inhibitor n=1 Tax=Turnera subulata TaxID=218843 RepID=A0A9Q0F3B2_9ROSI|nr:hypothetical protein Tsubulata_026621 [Turnera subulata]